MITLDSFGEDLDAVVVGASGGIGAALTRELAALPGVRRVHALSRTQAGDASAKVAARAIDILDEERIADAASGIAAEAPPKLVIVATGLLHAGDAIRPEKSLSQLDGAAMTDVLRVNTVGPALLAKHFLPIMARRGKTVFAALSARVGSIGDNRLGGWISYRASKAAVNMVVRTLAIEEARKRPESIVVGLHPGTVDTGLSRPYTRGRRPGSVFSPEQAARHLLSVIERLSPADSGGFLAWDGTSIEY